MIHIFQKLLQIPDPLLALGVSHFLSLSPYLSNYRGPMTLHTPRPPSQGDSVCKTAAQDPFAPFYDLATMLPYEVVLYPTIERIEPAEGGARGGSILTIHGAGFSPLPENNEVIRDSLSGERVEAGRLNFGGLVLGFN